VSEFDVYRKRSQRDITDFKGRERKIASLAKHSTKAVNSLTF
jgi:hypothetical protein